MTCGVKDLPLEDILKTRSSAYDFFINRPWRNEFELNYVFGKVNDFYASLNEDQLTSYPESGDLPESEREAFEADASGAMYHNIYVIPHYGNYRY